MKDLTGEKFGRLVVVGRDGSNKWGNCVWLCDCDCGNKHKAAGGKLLQGKVRSCGCLALEVRTKSLEKHGITTGGKPRTFAIWSGMKARCFNPKAASYRAYGKRGITVCDEWLIFENFHNWAMSNGYDDILTLDRINNNGNYEPSNCCWAPAHENYKRQRSARYFTIAGVTKNVSEWCRFLGVSKSTAYKHINAGNGQNYFTTCLVGMEEAA